MIRKITEEERRKLEKKGFKPSEMTFICEINGHKIIMDINEVGKGSHYVDLKTSTPILK